MFGIGGTELILILLVALVVLGPKSLTKFASSLGRIVGDFRRVSTEFQRTLNTEVAAEEYKNVHPKSPAPVIPSPPEGSPLSAQLAQTQSEAIKLEKPTEQKQDIGENKK